jgi:threonine dehydrogenase-like Zn-dependent dehydrogenase
VSAASFGARIVVASFYGKRRAPIDLGDAFHRRRLTLVASQVSTLPARLAQRFDPDRRFAIVLELLAEPALDALLAPPVSFDRAPELYAALDRDADGPPCPVFVYR